MSKPCPPPPNYQPQGNRTEASQAKAVDCPFDKVEEVYEDPRMTDEEVLAILRRTLRRDQLDDPRIIKFILAWTVSRSNPDAAEAAGLKRSQGSYWRSRPEIHKAIEEITAIAVVKHGYDASEMIERAKEIANLDPIEFQNPDGSFKTHLSQIKPEARRAIKKFEAKNLYGQDANGMQIVIGQLLKVEIWDKLKGIEMLGSEKNIFKKTTVVQHDVTSNMADVLLESGKRADERKLLMAREVSPEAEAAYHLMRPPEGEEDATGEDSDSDSSGRDGGGVSKSERSGSSGSGRSSDDLQTVFEED